MESLSSFLNVKEVATYLAVRTSTLYSMIEKKRVPHYRIGRLIRFKKSEIDEWMNYQKEPAVDRRVKPERVGVSFQKNSTLVIDRIVKKSIDEVKGNKYTSQYGKPDRIKGLRKEVEDGTL